MLHCSSLAPRAHMGCGKALLSLDSWLGCHDGCDHRAAGEVHSQTMRKRVVGEGAATEEGKEVLWGAVGSPPIRGAGSPVVCCRETQENRKIVRFPPGQIQYHLYSSPTAALRHSTIPHPPITSESPCPSVACSVPEEAARQCPPEGFS